MTEQAEALVVGGGPAGLMAAERLLMAGHKVLLCDAMPSLGRKLLMAGKSGLNLTKSEPAEQFRAAYGKAADWLAPALEFGPQAVQNWAEGLGQPLFTGSSGRVFPVAMKASPLLRSWLQRLDGAGLQRRTGWKLTDLDGLKAEFTTSGGRQVVQAKAIILALGGASWSRLGSDGKWTQLLAEKAVPLAPFQPSNMGFSVPWSAKMTPHFGKAVKPVALQVAGQRHRGEIVITAQGLEGGGLYQVSAALRDGASLSLDLIPDLPAARAIARLTSRASRETASRALTRGLGLDPVRLAVAMEFGRPWPRDTAASVARIKALPVPLGPPQPIDRAISTAGGIRADALTDGLMLRALPGVFAAGEMLDWEAPTGGYLLTACLGTGRLAGDSAAAWLDAQTAES